MKSANKLAHQLTAQEGLVVSSSTSRRELHDAGYRYTRPKKIPLVKLKTRFWARHGLDWPTNSPDLAPLENLWGIIKRRVELPTPQNVHELEDAIQAEWQLFPLYDLLPYIERLCSRMRLCVASGGNAIKK